MLYEILDTVLIVVTFENVKGNHIRSYKSSLYLLKLVYFTEIRNRIHRILHLQVQLSYYSASLIKSPCLTYLVLKNALISNNQWFRINIVSYNKLWYIDYVQKKKVDS